MKQKFNERQKFRRIQDHKVDGCDEFGVEIVDVQYVNPADFMKGLGQERTKAKNEQSDDSEDELAQSWMKQKGSKKPAKPQDHKRKVVSILGFRKRPAEEDKGNLVKQIANKRQKTTDSNETTGHSKAVASYERKPLFRKMLPMGDYSSDDDDSSSGKQSGESGK